METIYLYGLIILAVAAMIFAISKLKIHPFIALVTVAIAVGLIWGMEPISVIDKVKEGFGSILASIGIVILCGTIIGKILEKSGAALTMANFILKIVGKNNSVIAIAIMGYITGIPVFCDSGFVVLSPINRALAEKSGTSLAVMATALSGGLYATHCLVPPTPGPIAMAGTLNADLGLTIIVGLLISIPALIVAVLYSKKFSSKIDIPANSEYSLEELQKMYGDLPGVVHSFSPIILPIILIALASIAAFPSYPFGKGFAFEFLNFIGNPVIALLIGVFLSMTLIPKKERENTLARVSEGVNDSAAIISITAAGGSFGAILQTLPIAETTTGLLQSGLGVFIPFIIAMIFKLAMGASTVAMITTASMMAPLMETMGFVSPIARVLIVMAIGAGSMVASHSNDSYFWVVSQFSDMNIKQAYKTQTGMTALMGCTLIIIIFILSKIFI